MSGHLCLKWNNHSSAFLKSISNIQVKERYCDATIVCQGRYFPVHRVVLSTCSDYFDEMFERMQCQHPYIVFKDIEPREMELLLNYMYQGEVNVVQEMLPTLIKAAEALKVKGLAVPDDLPSGGKKRSSTSSDNPQPKRRLEDSKRRRRDSANERNQESENNELENFSNNDVNHSESMTTSSLPTNSQLNNDEPRLIKEEPLDSCSYGEGSLPSENPMIPHPSESPVNKEESVFVNFPISDDASTYIKSEENLSPGQSYQEQQSSSWSDFGGGTVMPNLPPSEMARQDDIMEANRSPVLSFQVDPSLSGEMFSPSRGGKSRSKGQSMYYCEFCEYKSNNSKNLKTHTFLHTGERPFPCTLCPARYIKKVDLENHTRIHTGERPFKCPTCSLTFRVKDHLKKHLNKKFKCVKISDQGLLPEN